MNELDNWNYDYEGCRNCPAYEECGANDMVCDLALAMMVDRDRDDYLSAWAEYIRYFYDED